MTDTTTIWFTLVRVGIGENQSNCFRETTEKKIEVDCWLQLRLNWHSPITASGDCSSGKGIINRLQNTRYTIVENKSTQPKQCGYTGIFLSLLLVQFYVYTKQVVPYRKVTMSLHCHVVVQQTLDNPFASACRLYGNPPAVERRAGY